ncbi:MAG: NAD-dependent malic enzyme [Candidatus Omnitrophica bacterium]|nr:NAD-dependent malic enzyme [Candidatus Omnitrophota bacterium]
MTTSSDEFSPSYTLTLRMEIPNSPGMLGQITTKIGGVGGNIGAIDIVDSVGDALIRDITVNVRDEAHGKKVARIVREVDGVKLVSVSDKVFLLHLGGKISVEPKVAIHTREALSRAYTPGVARVCQAIHEHPRTAFNLTIKSNTVAVVTDGTAVLGLGDIGPEAALPVMEGKAMLFKEFGAVDAFPICLRTKDPDEIVAVVKAIAPTFGGINLEDISAPRCFGIEQRLREDLEIPVFHDDQHGTAVVVLAAAINAAKVVDKKISEMKAVILGTGAAGSSCAQILLNAGIAQVICCDSKGIIYQGRKENMNPSKERIAEMTNPERIQGSVMDACSGADIFIGVSGPRTVTADAIKKMARDPIVFALANPDPEIDPHEAATVARIVATGRSDYPNQINNVLCFPGIFRGALDVRAREINEEMKLAAAKAIAGTLRVGELSEDYIIPSVFNKAVVRHVAEAVAKAAVETGVARRKRPLKDRAEVTLF